MQWLRNHKLPALGVALLIAAALWINRPQPQAAYPSQPGVSPVVVSTVAGPPKYALHILFIGNSFTYYHDIPKMVADIASADPGNQTQFTVQAVTMGGITLKELWEDGKAAAAIRSRHWDYVALQEVSSWAMMPQWVLQAMDYAKRFNALIRQDGAQPLLALTWVDKPGSHWYTDHEYAYKRNPDYMLRTFIAQTSSLAGKLGARTVDIGLYWQYVLVRHPEIELYMPDQHHPSMAGSYLAALVYYKTLTGRDVTRIPFRPPGVDEATAAAIRAIVAHPQ